MAEAAKKPTVKQQLEGLLGNIERQVAEIVVFIAENDIRRADTNLRAVSANLNLAKAIAANISN